MGKKTVKIEGPDFLNGGAQVAEMTPPPEGDKTAKKKEALRKEITKVLKQEDQDQATTKTALVADKTFQFEGPTPDQDIEEELAHFPHYFLEGDKEGHAFIGPYRIQNEISFDPKLENGMLGEGGMGLVFAAVHRETGEECAIKILPTDVKSDLRHFQAETIVMDRIKHRRIMRMEMMGRVSLADDARQHAFFVMQRCQGNMSDVSDEVIRMSEEEKLNFIESQILPLYEAMETAHQGGIIHNDLKPQNILRDKDGNLIIADMGLGASISPDPAKGKNPVESMKRFDAGSAIGTPHFMAPEQAKGVSHMSPAGDIYNLSASCFACLTGELPFQHLEGATPKQILTNLYLYNDKIMDDAREKFLRSEENNCPPHCAVFFVDMMAKDPEKRKNASQRLRKAIAKDREYLRTGEL